MNRQQEKKLGVLRKVGYLKGGKLPKPKHEQTRETLKKISYLQEQEKLRTVNGTEPKKRSEQDIKDKPYIKSKYHDPHFYKCTSCHGTGRGSGDRIFSHDGYNRTSKPHPQDLDQKKCPKCHGSGELFGYVDIVE